jgi:hypothetical protein
MSTQRRLTIPVIGLIAASFLVGCGPSDNGRMQVNGSVKLHGMPISDGAIVIFAALENQGTEATATVSKGSYIVSKETGLKPGRYLVRITAGDGKTAVNPVDENNPPGPTGSNIISKDLVPADWNVNSKQEVTVTKDGPNRIDFDIP